MYNLDNFDGSWNYLGYYLQEEVGIQCSRHLSLSRHWNLHPTSWIWAFLMTPFIPPPILPHSDPGWGGSKILILDKLCCLSFSLAQGTGGINTIQNIKLYKIWKLTSTFIFKDDLNKFLLQVSRQTRHISSSFKEPYLMFDPVNWRYIKRKRL